MSRSKRIAVMGAAGLLLGFSLSWIGFSDFGEVHRMFMLADPRLFLTFAGAVALVMVGLLVIRAPRAARPIQRGTVIGSVLFGVGWATTGACPAVGLVQLGEGHLIAMVTIVGIVVGARAHSFVQARYLRWETSSCDG